MGLATAAMLSGLTTVLPTGKLGELVSLCVCVVFGLLVYFFLTLGLRLSEAKLILSVLKHLRKRG